MTARTLGILLAGGRGERLGMGQPKALAQVGGMTLLDYPLISLGRFCQERIVVAPAEIDLPLHEQPIAYRRLIDPGVGPLGGIAVAARAVSCTRAIVMGVDFPMAGDSLLRMLLERLGERRAVVPRPGGHPQPLLAAYSAEGLSLLAEAFERGERSVVRALDALDPLLLDDTELIQWLRHLDAFFDVDTPEDLAEAERRLRAAAVRR